MDDPTRAAPAHPAMPEHPPGEVRAYDPPAVALGNASLLGVGYLMLRRRALAGAAVAVTVVLVWLLAATASPSYEIAVLVWWAGTVLHGWYLAARGGAERPGPRVRRRQRLVALGVALPVLLVVGLLRFDAGRIGQDVTDARNSGDCARVRSAQDRVWFGHRVTDAPLSARGGEAAEACDELATAEVLLDTALTGKSDALEEGFGTLARVLAEPGNEKTVETTLNGFLRGLPAEDPCDTVTVTDWLRDRERSHDVLDRSAGAVGRTAPAALVGCGDALMAKSSWESARTHYERLLDRYPGEDALAAKAHTGVTKATRSIELDNVRNLLYTGAGGQPEYCSSPAKYSGAKPLGKGTNPALFYAEDTYGDDYEKKLPGSWKATSATDAVLVVCMGEETFGSSVQTCPYRGRTSGATTYVTFHKIAIPVKVYELRTGELVANRKIQINGTSCPSVISYYAYGDSGPPSSRYVSESASDVRNAFRPLVSR